MLQCGIRLSDALGVTMRYFDDTMARWGAIWTPPVFGGPSCGKSLEALTDFGSNPGALAGWCHVEAGHAEMPLVVVLHGCTQTAAGYDRGSGWSELANRFGFALLLPEQSRANNPNGCFNWFSPDDTRRDGGEAASIRQMVAAMVERHPIDSKRIFVTGLSAGGAMTSVMLANFPEVFVGGAIIAGLPFGAAASIPEAFDRMRGRGHASDDAAAVAILGASDHRGPWPVVGVWHGSSDRTVDLVNADRIVGQWRLLQGLAVEPERMAIGEGHDRSVWRTRDGEVRIEEHRILGMGHGTPIGTSGETACGTPMPFMLDVGISSTWQIARGWGLLGKEREVRSSTVGASHDTDARMVTATPSPSLPSTVQATINTGLRAVGLMR